MRKKWRAVDSWGYVKDDATRENVEATVAQMKDSHKGARVRVFKRTVKAGNAVMPITVIVAQVPIPQALSSRGYIVQSKWANPNETFEVYATTDKDEAEKVRDGLNRTSRGGSWRGAFVIETDAGSRHFRDLLLATPAEDVRAIAEREI